MFMLRADGFENVRLAGDLPSGFAASYTGVHSIKQRGVSDEDKNHI